MAYEYNLLLNTYIDYSDPFLQPQYLDGKLDSDYLIRINRRKEEITSDIQDKLADMQSQRVYDSISSTKELSSRDVQFSKKSRVAKPRSDFVGEGVQSRALVPFSRAIVKSKGSKPTPKFYWPTK